MSNFWLVYGMGLMTGFASGAAFAIWIDVRNWLKESKGGQP